MWFGFSLIIFLSISIYSFYKNFIQPRPKFDKSLNNIPYFIRKLSDKSYESRREIGFEVAIQIPKTFGFQFKRENFIDRLFKRLRLSHEFQTGYDDFDKTIYISSDNSELQKLLGNNLKIQQLILSIFKIGPRWSHCVKNIRALNGVLTLTYEDSGTWESSDKQKIIESSILSLEQLVSLLLNKSVCNIESYKDPLLNRFLFFSCINLILILLGYSSYARYGFSDSVPFTVDISDLLTLSIICTLIVIFILSALLVKFLNKSSRTHLLLLELISIGSICLFITFLNEIRLYNQHTDISQPVKYTTKVIDKYISRSKRSTTYNIKIQSWKKGIKSTSIRVDLKRYKSIFINDSIEVFQRNGAINIRWIESIRFIAHTQRKEIKDFDSSKDKGTTQYKFDFKEINQDLEKKRIVF